MCCSKIFHYATHGAGQEMGTFVLYLYNYGINSDHVVFIQLFVQLPSHSFSQPTMHCAKLWKYIDK